MPPGEYLLSVEPCHVRYHWLTANSALVVSWAQLAMAMVQDSCDVAVYLASGECLYVHVPYDNASFVLQHASVRQLLHEPETLVRPAADVLAGLAALTLLFFGHRLPVWVPDVLLLALLGPFTMVGWAGELLVALLLPLFGPLSFGLCLLTGAVALGEYGSEWLHQLFLSDLALTPARIALLWIVSVAAAAAASLVSLGMFERSDSLLTRYRRAGRALVTVLAMFCVAATGNLLLAVAALILGLGARSALGLHTLVWHDLALCMASITLPRARFLALLPATGPATISALDYDAQGRGHTAVCLCCCRCRGQGGRGGWVGGGGGCVTERIKKRWGLNTTFGGRLQYLILLSCLPSSQRWRLRP